MAWSSATRRVLSFPGRTCCGKGNGQAVGRLTGIRSCSKPACRESSWPATCGTRPPKALRPEWAKAQWPSSSSTNISARCNHGSIDATRIAGDPALLRFVGGANALLRAGGDHPTRSWQGVDERRRCGRFLLCAVGRRNASQSQLQQPGDPDGDRKAGNVSRCDLHESLKPEHWQPLVDASQTAIVRLAKSAPLDSVARSDREEEVTTWLEQHGVPDGWKLAPAFVGAGLDGKELTALAGELPGEALRYALGWLEASLSLNSLLNEIDGSTGRIAELVKAVKSYSHMDKSPMQEVDVHEGIESTLTMLGHKLKNVAVTRKYDHAVPHIMAYGGELNQVWTNLIDNAIFAVKGDRKSTRLNSSHTVISYAVFCLKKKKKMTQTYSI